jgi:hypothetical protein
MVDVQNSPIQTASVRLCGVLALSDFYLFGPLNKHLHVHRCPNYVEAQEAISQLFHFQSLELGAECTHLVITSNSCMNLQSGYVEKYVIVFYSHKKWYIEQKVANKQIFPVSYYLLDPCGYDVYIGISLFIGPWDMSGLSHNPVTLLWLTC